MSTKQRIAKLIDLHRKIFEFPIGVNVHSESSGNLGTTIYEITTFMADFRPMISASDNMWWSCLRYNGLTYNSHSSDFGRLDSKFAASVSAKSQPTGDLCSDHSQAASTECQLSSQMDSQHVHIVTVEWQIYIVHWIIKMRSTTPKANGQIERYKTSTSENECPS
jgi:hypothetical protein